MTVKVKPLVWEYYKDNPHRVCRSYCDTLRQEWIIWIDSEDVEAEKAKIGKEREARILAAIEATAQEPVAWQCKDYADGWITYTARHADQAREYQEATGCTIRPLYATPPDHLALVAAAYRDAADIADDDDGTRKQWGEHRNQKVADITAKEIMDAILARTPADAEAHLTALLRAEYERGVRDARDAMRDAVTEAEYEAAILALLTREGR